MPAHDEHDELAQTAVTLVGKHGDDAIPSGCLQIVVIGDGTFATHQLANGAALTIGRSNRCDIPVDDKSLSRRHAIVNVGETAATIEDLGSVNGTRVRGTKVRPGRPITIAVGELVGLGKVNIMLQQRSRPSGTPTVPLRKVWAHDYFEVRLREECAREERSGAAFALLHIHADRVAPAHLVEDALGELLRESDIVGKHAPHVYEALLPDTSPSKADEAARRIDRGLRERGLRCDLFAACCPRDGRSSYALVAKVQGRLETSARPMIVRSPTMVAIYQMIEQVAPGNISVLITGETGSGKERLAAAIHERSPRSHGPFVRVNCAALQEQLLEAELFGYVKGAFTGAFKDKVGLLEHANGGTLLLDEIGEMQGALQAKMLQMLEDKAVRPVGGLEPKPVDVRILAATDRDLTRMIEDGLFRADLYWRLCGISIVVPPLRERRDEILVLAEHFLEKYALEMHKTSPKLTPEVVERLCAYGWPGNVRQLRNVMERVVLLSRDGQMDVADLQKATAATAAAAGHPTSRATTEAPSATRNPAVEPPSPRDGNVRNELEAVERERILEALDSSGQNQTIAAKRLGMPRRTLLTKLDRYQIQRPRKK